MRNFKRLLPLFLILILLMSGAKSPTEKLEPKNVELRGKIVCLAEEMHTHYKVELFNKHDHLYGVKTADGKYYTLLRTSLAEALFVDERLHEKDLVISGRVFPKTQLLEVTRFLSIRDGVLHDLYYYCDTCYIRTVAPGDCDCCQAPVVLIERPLNVDSTIPSP
ncbi:hypothetical protein F4054_04220 [Candidatus Poribacteria bacterium]|nr:hypothetical protein [Candidatus Poribacteria bacterium]MYG07225.1 hypothetical protein [Candidatus Poribacteria bacterium]MYK21449.1 hypothetical protein [Candidatus Poribacteria bacterium]